MNFPAHRLSHTHHMHRRTIAKGRSRRHGLQNRPIIVIVIRVAPALGEGNSTRMVAPDKSTLRALPPADRLASYGERGDGALGRGGARGLVERCREGALLPWGRLGGERGRDGGGW